MDLEEQRRALDAGLARRLVLRHERSVQAHQPRVQAVLAHPALALPVGHLGRVRIVRGCLERLDAFVEDQAVHPIELEDRRVAQLGIAGQELVESQAISL